MKNLHLSKFYAWQIDKYICNKRPYKKYGEFTYKKEPTIGEYNMINKNTAKKGFTLVEIMIVVVIIGLLAAMAIPAFNKVRATSQDKAVTNNLRQYASAAQQYMLDGGVSTVDYSDIVGSGLHISVLATVADETYTGLTLGTNTTRLQATVNGRIINYDF